MAYTYLIGWKNLDRWYYGYRSVSRVPEQDLWKRYFTSSKLVKNFIKKHGSPDIVRIHKVFEFGDQARLHESKFLKRVNARKSERWLNQTNGDSKWTTKPGKIMSDEEKELRRKASTGLKAYHNSDGIVKKFKDEPGDGWVRGYPPNHHGLKGFKHSEESKANMGKPLGTKESEESRKRKSESYFKSELKQKLLKGVQQANIGRRKCP